MALSVQQTRSFVSGESPDGLLSGQLAFNLADNILFLGNGSNSRIDVNGIEVLPPPPEGEGWVAFSLYGGGGGGGGSVNLVQGSAPIQVTGSVSNPVVSISAASVTDAGSVQLSDSTSSTSTTLAATANSVRTTYILASQANANAAQAQADASSALTTANLALPRTGGTMTGNIVFNGGQTFPGVISGVTAVGGSAITVNNAIPTQPAIGVNVATTSAPGVVQLNNTTSSASTTQALTAAQGKVLQDQINALSFTTNLTFAGTFDASQAPNGEVDGVTPQGTAENFVVGSALPVPASSNDGYFVIIDVAGNSGPAGTTGPYNIGDWFVSDGANWSLLNVGYVAPYASTTTQGEVILSTNALVQAGSDTSTVVTPSGLQSKLSDSVSSTSSTTIASSKAVKTANDAAVAAGIVASSAQDTADQAIIDAAAAQSTANAALPKAGGTMTGDIVFNSSQTFPVGGIAFATTSTPGLVQIGSNISVSSGIISVAAGSTSTVGVLQLTDSVSSSSTTTAATPNSVKTANDAAVSAQTTANAALPKSGGTMTGNITFSGGQTFPGVVTSVSASTPLSSTGGATPSISLDNSGATAGTYTNATVTVTAKGIVTAASSGTAPVTSVTGTAPISVTAGTTPVVSVAAASTTSAGVVQLVDNTNSTSTTQALTANQGRLLQDQIDGLAVSSNLTLAGTFDADQSELVTVTDAGALEGFTQGSDLPNASSTNANYFVIVTVAGTYTPPGGSTPYDAGQGDWFLSNGTVWEFYNVGFDAPYASIATPGIVRLASNAETQAGADATIAVTPAGGNATYVYKSCYAAKGDILAASGPGTTANIALGTNGQILTVDTSCAAGVKWGANLPSAATPTVAGIVLGCTTASNTALGCNAGVGNINNVYVGVSAAAAAAPGLTSNNVAIGFQAACSLTTASSVTAVGCGAGSSLTTGNCNVLIGTLAGCNLTTGYTNVAIGYGVTLPSATNCCQMAIGVGTNYWLTGNSNFAIKPGGGIIDCAGSCGTAGQILSSTGTALQWANGSQQQVASCTAAVTLSTEATSRNLKNGDSLTIFNSSLSSIAITATSYTNFASYPTQATSTVFTLPAKASVTLVVSNTSTNTWYIESFNSPVATGTVVFEANLSTNYSVTALSKVPFNVAAVDPQSYFNTTTNRYIPQVAGYYFVTAQLYAQANSQWLYTQVRKNGNIEFFAEQTSTPNSTAVPVTGIVYMNGSTDYLEVWTASGANATLNSGATETYFTGFLINQTITQGANTPATPTALGLVYGNSNNSNANVFLGYNAGKSISTGGNNTYIGQNAGCSQSGGFSNIAIGLNAGCSNTSGNNTFIGVNAGKSVSTGSYNVLVGEPVGCSLTTGTNNTHMGFGTALGDTGSFNTYIGSEAGKCATSGCWNVAVGQAAFANISANSSCGVTAIGQGSLRCAAGIGGSNSVAVGVNAGCGVTTGVCNILIGPLAGYNLTTGQSNVAIGPGVVAPSATANFQLALGVGTSYWLTGDSNYNIKPGGGIRDCAGNLGTANQVLTSTGLAVQWASGLPTNWIQAGTIQTVGFQASTTTPIVTGSYVTNMVSYRQIGPKMWEVNLCIDQGGGIASAGSGDYIFTLPNGLSFDLTVLQQRVFTGGVGTTSPWFSPLSLAGSNGGVTDGNIANVSRSLGALIWSSNKYRVTTGATNPCWGSGYYTMSGAVSLNLTFQFQST